MRSLCVRLHPIIVIVTAEPATAADAKDQISGIKDLPASQLTEGTSRPRRVL
jgi:hypothetical protein